MEEQIDVDMREQLIDELRAAAESGWPQPRLLADLLQRDMLLSGDWLQAGTDVARTLALIKAAESAGDALDAQPETPARNLKMASLIWMMHRIVQSFELETVVREAGTPEDAVQNLAVALQRALRVPDVLSDKERVNFQAVLDRLTAPVGGPGAAPGSGAGAATGARARAGGGALGKLFTISTYPNWVGQPSAIRPGSFAKLRPALNAEILEVAASLGAKPPSP